MRKFVPSRSILASAVFLLAAVGMAQQPFSLDPSFTTTIINPVFVGGPNVSSILPLEDGSMIISGQFRFLGDPQSNRTAAKLYPDGSFDPTFPAFAGGWKLTRWGDTYYSGVGQTVRRFTFNGIYDSAFASMNADPFFSSLQGGDYHLFPDGSLVYGGVHILSDTVNGFTGLHNFIWFTNTGRLDSTKIHRPGSGAIYMIKQQNDGKFICSGTVTMQEGQPVNRVFRLHADGALDGSFDSPIYWGTARSCTPLEDGKLLVSGLFKAYGPYSDTLHILRLMPDGSIDLTFNNELDLKRPGGGQFFPVLHTRLSDGRIVIHGSFREVDDEERGGIAILDQNGLLLQDSFTGGGCGTFVFNNLTYGSTAGIMAGHDDMWYIWGSYIGYDGDTLQRFVSRLHPPDITTDVLERGAQNARPTLQLYPNPTDGLVMIDHDLQAQATGRTFIRIRDALGRSLESHQLANEKGQLVIDTWRFEAGMYTVELINGDRMVHLERLIVH